jgi:DNA polymerase-3 subunit delta'
VKILENIVGQPQVIEALKNAVIAARENSELSQKMTHSWLFTGPPGSGKSTVAKVFAASLLCSNSGCGECVDCITAMDGSHLDIDILKTEVSSIKVNEIRELISRTSTSPSISNWRVVIIQDAQRLTEAATNALLKVIEEPSSRTIWLMTASTSLDLLATLRSRCRQIQLKTPDKESIIELLVKRDKIDSQIAEFAARVSQGHIGRAKYLSENPISRSRRNDVIELFLTVNDTSSAFSAASKIIDIAQEEAEDATRTTNEIELINLQDALQGPGKSLISGGAKSVKELEKDQKARIKRAVEDSLDRYLLDLLSIYRDSLLNQLCKSAEVINTEYFARYPEKMVRFTPESIIIKIENVLSVREKLAQSTVNLLAMENLICTLIQP